MNRPTQTEPDRVLARCRELVSITDVPGETTRTFLSPATREAHTRLTQWMEAAGLAVHTDAIGNLHGLRPGPASDSPRLLIGSHIDTVPNAGAFDGPLGVLLGLALIESLDQTELPYAIELIAFSEEEGVRFAKPFLGSLALIGQLDPTTLARTDQHNISVAEAIHSFGLDPAQLPAARAHPASAAYLEVHIEQGPVLDAEGRPLGVVEAIAGQTRIALTFTGQSNHAGTTPMGPLRRDALASAAEWIVEVERFASAVSGLVATVGRLDIPSPAANIIPGAVHTALDLRSPSDSARRDGAAHLLAFATQSAARRGVRVAHTVTLDQPAVPMDPGLTQQLAASVVRVTGAPARLLPSGAGHDAMIVARQIPSAMLFVRSPAGLSHHPEESVIAGDVSLALDAGLDFLANLKL